MSISTSTFTLTKVLSLPSLLQMQSILEEDDVKMILYNTNTFESKSKLDTNSNKVATYVELNKKIR